jgi:hypothetical protein
MRGASGGQRCPSRVRSLLGSTIALRSSTRFVRLMTWVPRSPLWLAIRQGILMRHYKFSWRAFGLLSWSSNNVERWSCCLATTVAHFIGGLFRFLSWAEASVEVGFIVGNCEFTPFGVHNDGEGLYIAHLHLGPSRKRMFIWEPQAFVRSTGSTRSFFKPSSIITAAHEVALDRGDVLLFPGSAYHVGCCQGDL